MLKKSLHILLFIFALSLPACFEAPAQEDTPSSSKGTKSATITITETALQVDTRGSIAAVDIGEYQISAQPIDTATNFSVTLYNAGDVAAEKIKAFSLSSPLSYAGGSYPGTGGTCTTKLRPSETCTIVIQFLPLQMGQNSATLQLGYYNGKTTRIFEQIFKGTGYSVPNITSITQNIGPTLGGTTISLLGTHLFSGVRVTLGGQICSYQYYPPTGVTCLVPAHNIGAVDVTVTNTDGKSFTVPSGFTYVPAPIVTSVSPTAGALAGGTTLTITGSNFLSNATVMIGGHVCNSVSVNSSSSVTCITSAAGAEIDSVQVINRDGQIGTLSNGYTYQPAPTVTSISPTSGLIGGGDYLTITGTGFVSGATASIGGTACSTTLVTNATTLTCVAPSGSVGSKDVVVTNTDSQGGTGSGLYSYSTGEEWTTITTINIPRLSYNGTGVWTGSKAIFYGGASGGYSNTGIVYDPVTGSSTLTITTAAPPTSWALNAVWTGNKMIVWGGYNGIFHNTGGMYDPLTNTWESTTTTGAPSPRQPGPTVWTGSKMIIWNGGPAWDRTGGIFDPETNSWSQMTTINAPTGSVMTAWTGKYLLTLGGKYDPEANTWTSTSTVGYSDTCYMPPNVWTGNKLFVACGNGYIYNFNTDSWSQVSTLNSPGQRDRPQLTWTGNKIIFFGGYMLPNTYLTGPPVNTGALYDPETNTWETVTTLNAALGGMGQNPLLWTGKQAIVWGGVTYEYGGVLTTGGLYTPPVPDNSNTWTAITTTSAPSSRYAASIVWTGSKAIVYGGWNCGGACDSGGMYDPLTNSWSYLPLTTTRASHSAIWTDSKMFVWGGDTGAGYRNTGEFYDPSTNAWSSITTTGAPSPRRSSALFTMGTKIFVIGGVANPTSYNDGAYYSLESSTWTSISTLGAPTGRGEFVWSWNGRKFVEFGGYIGFVGPQNTGGIYDAVADTWTASTTTNAPSFRTYHTGVWSGSQLIVWGGTPDFTLMQNNGGMYDPEGNSWTQITTLNAPQARSLTHSAWTGSEMVVWGGVTGSTASTVLNTGGKYNPQTGIWKETTTTASPPPSNRAAAIWTGSKFFIFGGNADPAVGVGHYNTGGFYTP